MERAFAEVKRALEDGDVIGLFPEGKINVHWELNEFRLGIERIIGETAVPVVPMALRGLGELLLARRGVGDEAPLPSRRPLADRAGRGRAGSGSAREREGARGTGARAPRRYALSSATETVDTSAPSPHIGRWGGRSHWQMPGSKAPTERSRGGARRIVTGICQCERPPHLPNVRAGCGRVHGSCGELSALSPSERAHPFLEPLLALTCAAAEPARPRPARSARGRRGRKGCFIARPLDAREEAPPQPAQRHRHHGGHRGPLPNDALDARGGTR